MVLSLSSSVCLQYGKSSLKQLLLWLPSHSCDLLFLCNWGFISLFATCTVSNGCFEDTLVIVIISNSFTSHCLFSCRAKIEIGSCPNHSSWNSNALSQISMWKFFSQVNFVRDCHFSKACANNCIMQTLILQIISHVGSIQPTEEEKKSIRQNTSFTEI